MIESCDFYNNVFFVIRYNELLGYIAHFQHKEYLSSDRWKKLRYEILKRDNFTCQDCGNRARDVRHLDYGYLGTSEEAKFCISLCRECHKKRHNISSPSFQTLKVLLRRTRLIRIRQNWRRIDKNGR